ncbi:MAG: hypothetical protein PHQ12_01605 [Chthoniobacteraceae bacterium]|nr:hypothetical protein [Chthoniobacteraceae bacterium]
MKQKLFKTLRILFFGLVVLVTLAALWIAEESFRGKRAWENHKREAEARGEKFALAAFVPPPVPDDENFAMTPLLKPLFGPDTGYGTRLGETLKIHGTPANSPAPVLVGMWKAQRVDLKGWGVYLGDPDILGALEKYDTELSEISEASRRRFSRFPIPYEEGFAARLPHITALMGLQRLYTLRALAALSQGDADRAFADEQTLNRLALSVSDEPLLISQLVRLSILSLHCQVIWEGLAAHQWSDTQLTAMQGDLSRLDLLKDVRRALESERAAAADYWPKVVRNPGLLQQMTLMGPAPETARSSFMLQCTAALLRARAWQNLLVLSQFYERYLRAGVDPSAHRVLMEPLKAAEAEMQRLAGTYSLDTPLARLTIPAITPSISKFASSQTTVDEALIACGLERYRLAHGGYPETLEALVPQYLAKLPHDVITGEPLHYRRTTDGLFLLYSVGWNERDDGGVPGVKDKGRQDIQQGDWVWRYPSAQ